MIPSDRSIVLPIAIIIFTWFFLFCEILKSDSTCVKIMITTGLDWWSAWWIKNSIQLYVFIIFCKTCNLYHVHIIIPIFEHKSQDLKTKLLLPTYSFWVGFNYILSHCFLQPKICIFKRAKNRHSYLTSSRVAVCTRLQ